MNHPLALLLAASTCVVAEASDWPQFRGPAANGVATEGGVPTTWDESTNIAWTIDAPGEGWSAPIVVDGKVLLTVTDWDEPDSKTMRFQVVAYDLQSGAELWRRTTREAAPTEPTHRDNTYASETPVTDGERVYAYFGMNGLSCYTLDGEEVWKTDPGAYPMSNGWGTSSSPVLAGDKLFLQIDNRDESFLIAINTADGSEAWRVARPDEVSTWSTPTVWKNSQRTELVLGGATIRSYDPASGDELWSMPIGGRSSATAAPVGDVLYIGSEDRSSRGGTPGGLFAVKAGASGEIDVTDEDCPDLLWANLRGAIGISSPVVFGGQVYVPERRGGVLRLHDALTGEETNRKRLPGGKVFWSSPLAVDGRVLLIDDAGKTFVLAPGPEAEVVRTNSLPGRFWSTPAVADGALLIRSEDKLYCVRSNPGA